MYYVEHLNLFGIDFKDIPCLKGHGAPTAETEGAVGMLYMNIDNGDLYKCVSSSNDSIAWKPISSESGGIITDDVLSTSSTNPVQNKVIAEKITDIETLVGNIDILLGTI